MPKRVVDLRSERPCLDIASFGRLARVPRHLIGIRRCFRTKSSMVVAHSAAVTCHASDRDYGVSSRVLRMSLSADMFLTPQELRRLTGYISFLLHTNISPTPPLGRSHRELLDTMSLV
jgi:hypothetical protein